MRARFIQQMGLRGKLRIYWDEVVVKEIAPCHECPGGHPVREHLNRCLNAYGQGKPGSHDTSIIIGDKPTVMNEWLSFGDVEDYPPNLWPTQCKSCGEPVPQNVNDAKELGQSGIFLMRQVFVSHYFNTRSGDPEPGDVYWLDWHDAGAGECPYWDDCDGKHLWGILPNGKSWDIDARANNCTMKDDRNHRCWVRSGKPEDGTLHVDKNGRTCQAGAGSIAVEGWHGFLHHFEWRG